MKISTFALLSTLLGQTSAFGIAPAFTTNSRGVATQQSMSMYFADESGDDKKKEESKSTGAAPTIYDRLGFEEENLAIGIDEKEVLQWLGTKEDIVNRFMADNKGMEKEKAEEEVSKFMLDAEMVNSFIAYEKKKSDPKFLREQAEEQLSDPSTWGTYAVWIAGGAGFAYVKNVIIEPKYASGEWEEIHITLPGADKFGQAAAEKASEVATTTVAPAAVVEAVSSSFVVETTAQVADAAVQVAETTAQVVDAAAQAM